MAVYNQSKIKLFRRCQKAYSFRYDTVEGKELVPRTPKAALQRGTWLHALQEAHHREWATGDKHVQAALDKMDESWDQLFDEEKEEYGNMPGEVRRIFRAYRYHWKNTDPDRYSVATLNDSKPAIEFMVEYPYKEWTFKGRIDLMVEDHEYGGLWLWDSKWVGRIPGPDERMMSPQALMYAWACRKLGYDIQGFVYNYGRTKPPTIPPVLQSGLLTTRAKLDCDYMTYLECIQAHHHDEWKQYAKYVYNQKLLELRARAPMWFRRERIPVEPDRIKKGLVEFHATVEDIERRNLKIPPRSYDYTCRYGCDYYEPCVAQFTGLDIEGILKAKFTVEDERYGPGSEPPL